MFVVAGECHPIYLEAMASGLSPEHKGFSNDHHVDTLLAQYSSTPPTHRGKKDPSGDEHGVRGPTAGSELATSWAAIPTHINGRSPDPVDGTHTHTHTHTHNVHIYIFISKIISVYPNHLTWF